MNFLRKISVILCSVLISTQVFATEPERNTEVLKASQNEAYSFNIKIYNIETKNKFENLGSMSTEKWLSKINEWSSNQEYRVNEEIHNFDNIYLVDDKEIFMMNNDVPNNKAVSFAIKKLNTKDLIALKIDYSFLSQNEFKMAVPETQSYTIAMRVSKEPIVVMGASNKENKSTMTVIVITSEKK